MRGGKRRVEATRAVVEHLDNNNNNNKIIINQMMLRFRPIAPRPVSVENSVVLPVKEKRVKRKYVRANNNNNNNNNNKKISKECNYINYTSLDPTVAIITDSNRNEFVTNRLWISFDVSGNNNNNNNNNNSNNSISVSKSISNSSSSSMSRWITVTPPSLGLHGADQATVVNRRESWITVESVIGSSEEGGRGLGYITDLEMDRCPGFISNGFDEVQWVNLAYRRMVDPDPDDGAPVSVWLMVKVETIDFVYWPAFSCKVRVVYDLFNKKKKQMTVPCDVWKIDSGGYAWRLDVEAALSLGRLN